MVNRRCVMCWAEAAGSFYYQDKVFPVCSRTCIGDLCVALDVIVSAYEQERDAAQSAATERIAAAQEVRDAAIEALIRGSR